MHCLSIAAGAARSGGRHNQPSPGNGTRPAQAAALRGAAKALAFLADRGANLEAKGTLWAAGWLAGLAAWLAVTVECISISGTNLLWLVALQCGLHPPATTMLMLGLLHAMSAAAPCPGVLQTGWA